MKRFISALAALFFLVVIPGCNLLSKNEDTSSPDESHSGTSETTKKRTSGAFTLAYNSQDSLNPYKVKTAINLELCSLLYDGLTKIDIDMMPINILAASVESPDPLTLIAELQPNAKFSDGSKITSDEVVSSYLLARTSGYKVLLSNIKSAQPDGNRKIVFKLKTPDPNAAACLSFPVIKNGTSSKPIGSGRYIFDDEESPVLRANPHHSAKPANKTIRLIDIPNDEAMIYALASGSLSYYYTDLSGGVIPKTSGANINVPLNSLVFIGVNSKKTALSKKEVRLALSLSINRENICASAFAGRARAALTPFNPGWASAAEIKGLESKENINAAVAQLELAGYNNKNTADAVPKLELLVSKENSFRIASADLLKAQFEKTGFRISIKKLAHSEIIKKLKSGDFDLYIGEIKLPVNMSLHPFLTSGGSASYGIKTTGGASKAYNKYLSGEMTLQEFTDVFSKDIPFIPLCWRFGMASYNRALTGVSATDSDVYYGIENWIFN
ncbi:MAG: ABC transporter substrate-binding protein [Clostridiales bacterium]|jgi:peptide/nickel transport system substrate-binding protein|nr:ABC transporter substrate-binding protein [Clostridiales bacterium]